MKLITNIIILISIILTLYYSYLHLIPLDIYELLLSALSLVLLMVPIIIEKFSKIKIEKYIKLIYYFFLLISFILGGLFKLYYSTQFFDLIVHFLFGFFLTIILSKKIKINCFKNIFLIFMIVLSLGFLWECLEFVGDIFIGTDHQEKISGAADTMTDLLISILGACIYMLLNNILNKIRSCFA